jgi:hypothetical protein
MKWRILQSTFRMRRPKSEVIMRCCCILTNFLHRRRRNVDIIDLGNVEGGGWEGDEDE